MHKNHWITAAQGLCVGGTMLVPGVSGGSMAIILGIYDELVSSVSSFRKHKRKSALFLGVFCLGALLGMALFAKPLMHLIETYPKPMLYFFMGAVAGSVPMIFRKAGVRSIGPRQVLFFLLGLALIILFALLPEVSVSMESGSKFVYLLLILSGFLAAVALVLPGISVSYMLLLMGMYDPTMQAINTLYLPYLLPLGAGLLIGIVPTTKLLEKALTRFPQETYLMILAFLIGSVADIFPGVPSGIEILWCVILAAAGFAAIYFISLSDA